MRDSEHQARPRRNARRSDGSDSSAMSCSASPRRHPEHVAAIVAFEVAYQVLAVAEVYVTLRWSARLHPTLESALVLETVSRAITIVFKMLPMRVGVDEAGSSLSAGQAAASEPATGLTLALVRKLRVLFWSAIGLALSVRRLPWAAPMVADAISLRLPAQPLRAGAPLNAGVHEIPDRNHQPRQLPAQWPRPSLTVSHDLHAPMRSQSYRRDARPSAGAAKIGRRLCRHRFCRGRRRSAVRGARRDADADLCRASSRRTEVSNSAGRVPVRRRPDGFLFDRRRPAGLQVGDEGDRASSRARPSRSRLQLDLDALHEEVTVTASVEAATSNPIDGARRADQRARRHADRRRSPASASRMRCR